MKSLTERLNIDNKVYEITAKDFEEAIKKAFNYNLYSFNLNSELIDVNDRFRIFKYKNKNFIVKKSSLEDGNEEVKLSKKAYDKINGLIVDNFEISVVKPNLYIIDDFSYIVSEYYGVSLQECLYSNKLKVPFDVTTVSKILEKFINLGILYRGFLPRNTIVKDHIIYLLDWEDVIFCEDIDDININKLWETNFLLNWSYFFNIEVLQNLINKYKNDKVKEPALIKYEKRFGNWICFKGNDFDLRDKILKTVLFAESKVSYEDENFCVLPNDLAHLVSDLFNTDIDVLFDISCNNLRKKNEEIYYILIQKLSDKIVDLYYNKLPIQQEIIYDVLAIMEISTYDNERLNKLNDFSHIQNSKDSSLNDCLDIIRNVILEFCSSNCKNELLMDVYNYIQNIIVGGN